MSNSFLLGWRNHQSMLAGSIQEEREFQDVTLASEDQQLKAHMVVLAAGSPKLRNILLSNSQPHPLIYMCGVKFSVLENIVKFIYHGEVILSPEQVNTFLDVARDLQVNGLRVPSGGAGDEVSTNTRNREDEESPTVKEQPVAKVDEEDGNDVYHEDGDDGSLFEADEGEDAVEEEKNKICPHCHTVFSWPYSLKRHLKTHTKERPFSCQFCSKKFSRKDYLNDHVKIVHLDAGPHRCPHCNKTFNRKQHLQDHVNIIHFGERAQTCPHCSEAFAWSVQLRRHIKSQHPNLSK